MARTVPQIDVDINANRKALRAASGKFNIQKAAAWQRAWDRFPELRDRERALFLERDAALVLQYEAEYRAAMGEKRRERASFIRRRAA